MKSHRHPEAGERYMMCIHIEGSPLTGFKQAHILCVSNAAGATAQRSDGVDLDIRWFILCDACDTLFESDEQASLEGRDGVWPPGAVIDFDDHALN
jgi:hypothetical protein